MDAWQVIGLVVTVALAVVGAFWAMVRRGLENIERHGERIAVLENDVKHLNSEVAKVREVRHDIMDNVSKSLATWYISVIEKINAK